MPVVMFVGRCWPLSKVEGPRPSLGGRMLGYIAMVAVTRMELLTWIRRGISGVAQRFTRSEARTGG
jgi:hypothetical protein